MHYQCQTLEQVLVMRLDTVLARRERITYQYGIGTGIVPITTMVFENLKLSFFAFFGYFPFFWAGTLSDRRQKLLQKCFELGQRQKLLEEQI